MKFWAMLCSAIEFTMCLSRVPDRRGQVWQKKWFDSRKQEYTETLLVLEEPFPLRKTTIDRLLSDTSVWMRRGWLHKVVELETGRPFEINEKWFGSWSEQSLKEGQPGWKRVT